MIVKRKHNPAKSDKRGGELGLFDNIFEKLRKDLPCRQ